MAPPPSFAFTTEGGATAEFAVRLAAAPDADVIVPIGSSDEGEVLPAVTQLTFTPQNWNTSQPVTLAGVDDHSIDGNIRVTILIGPAQSADARFNGSNPDDFTIDNHDDDAAAVLVATPDGTFTSEGGSTFRVELTLAAQPAAPVRIQLSVSDPTEVSVTPADVTIAPQAWNVPTVVEVAGLDDSEVDDTQTVTLGFLPTESEDQAFHGLMTAGITLTNHDDEWSELVAGQLRLGAGFTVSSDGRFVAYRANVLPDGTELDTDKVVIMDTVTRRVVRTLGHDVAIPPRISGDGSAVAWAESLPFDSNVYRAAAPDWTPVLIGAGGFDGSVSITWDGRFVAFVAYEDDLPGDTNGCDDIYRFDAFSGLTTAVTDLPDYVPGEPRHITLGPHAFSQDGRYLVFLTNAGLIESDVNAAFDCYLLDQQAGTLTRITINANGSNVGGLETPPAISGNGRYIALQAAFRNNDGASVLGVYRTDIQTGTVQNLAVTGRAWVAISHDGNRVAFVTSTNVTPGDTNGRPDAFLRDVAAATTVRVSEGPAGEQLRGAVDHGVFDVALTASGSHALFTAAGTFDPQATPVPDTSLYLVAVP